jgi:hypothetical protein
MIRSEERTTQGSHDEGKRQVRENQERILMTEGDGSRDIRVLRNMEM